MLTRRALLSGGASVLALASLGGKANPAPLYVPEKCWVEPTPEAVVRPEKAASMTRLLSNAMMGERPRLGMSRVDGFVMNAGDVVLYGRNDPKREELRFDDLVVAMRAVTGVYGKNGAPGISLDWLPGGQEKVTNAQSIKFTTKAEMEHKLKSLNAICEEVANWSRVVNLPTDSHVTLDLLKADNEMKKAATGLKIVKVKGSVISAWDFELTEMMQEAKRSTFDEWRKLQRTENDPLVGVRFWFESGKISYVLDGSTAFLDVVQVVLRDVPARILAQNQESDIQTKVDAPELLNSSKFFRSRRAFSCSFTNNMNDIVRTGQPWQGLDDVFRHFALARTMLAAHARLNNVAKDLLFKTYEPMDKVQIPSHFIIGAVKYDPTLPFKDGPKQRIYMKCGGVDLSGTPIRSRAINTSDVQLAGRMALTSMNSCTTSCWDIT
jgi:hypothetical protein